MQDLILYLDWPPTVNNYYSHTRNGVFISKKGRLFTSSVLSDVKSQAPRVKYTEPFAMSVYMFPPDRRKRDLDNYMKALQDSLAKAGLMEDDSLIDQLYLYRGEGRKGGLAIVKIDEPAPILPLSLIEAGVYP